MRKEVGEIWYGIIRLVSSRCNFQQNLCRPYLVRRLKLLSEPCVCLLKKIIVLQYRFTSELYVKIGETCMPRGEFKHRYCSLPKLQIRLGIVALFEKIYDSDPILTVFSNIAYRGRCTIPLFQLSV
jgi:hypothetical protein